MLQKCYNSYNINIIYTPYFLQVFLYFNTNFVYIDAKPTMKLLSLISIISSLNGKDSYSVVHIELGKGHYYCMVNRTVLSSDYHWLKKWPAHGSGESTHYI